MSHPDPPGGSLPPLPPPATFVDTGERPSPRPRRHGYEPYEGGPEAEQSYRLADALVGRDEVPWPYNGRTINGDDERGELWAGGLTEEDKPGPDEPTPAIGTPKQERPSSRPRTRLGIAGLVCILIGIVFAVLGLVAYCSTDAPAVVGPPVITPLAPVETPAELAAPPLAAPSPVSSFGNGIYLVGTDVVPGTYTTPRQVQDSCYWQVSKDASGEDGAVTDRGGRGSGPQRVTLPAGVTFQTTNCGTWVGQ